MKTIKLLSKLYKTNLISPKGIITMSFLALQNGLNISTILRFLAKIHRNKIAISDTEKTLTFNELSLTTKIVAQKILLSFEKKYSRKIAIIIHNQTDFVVVTFAAMSIGADVFIINKDLGQVQLNVLLKENNFDLIIADTEVKEKIASSAILKNLKDIRYFSSETEYISSQKTKSSNGNINFLTGGTSGRIKIAKRKTSVFDFAFPFFALLTEIDLDVFNSVIIPLPLYHGFGFSTLLVALMLGKEVYLQKKFETKLFCKLIDKHNIDVLVVVPTILQRVYEQEECKLKSVKRIISGGAAISPNLVIKTLDKFGDVLYNLYGTTEAGFSVMATPQMLRQFPNTIGKPIPGVKLKILDEKGKKIEYNKVGRIYLRSKWSMKNIKDRNINTGDLGWINDDKMLFLGGRADEMIVSGGENVYPLGVENILTSHPDIIDSAVIGVDDKDYGKRLVAFVVTKNKSLSEKEIKEWLKNKIARFEMPRNIFFIDSMPLTSIGKKNKKKLIEILSITPK